jgi:DNA polymerase III delta prime subunit
MKHTIWVELYRPQTFEKFVGTESLKGDLKQWIEKGDFPNLIFYGKPGSGKTTIAKMIVKSIECDYLYINCSDENGIDVVRDKVKSFAGSASFKPLKVVIMDESDFLSINAQASLRAVIEQYSLTTRFIFTCNFIERVIEPLQSRLSPYELQPPTRVEISKHLISILEQEGVEFELKDVAAIVGKFYPDIRKTINVAQTCVVDKQLILSNKKFAGHVEIDAILKEFKNRTDHSFNNIRQIITDNEIRDFTELYQELYNRFQSAEATIIISEALYQSVTIPDKEICFMSCISKLLQNECTES